jgi:benzoyl-CoA reductase/2-hydroxyglutaryl-CoA dehydratase subunit BcrC/BadD/HgdB
LGVPPIYPEIYSYLESRGGRVVYNEIQRQFAMYENAGNIYEQYLHYTYPYHIQDRLDDIKKQIKLRKIDALIHYVQSFCHRQIEDLIVKKEIKLPVLTIEGDRPFSLDERLKLRIESFLEMLNNRDESPGKSG